MTTSQSSAWPLVGLIALTLTFGGVLAGADQTATAEEATAQQAESADEQNADDQNEDDQSDTEADEKKAEAADGDSQEEGSAQAAEKKQEDTKNADDEEQAKQQPKQKQKVRLAQFIIAEELPESPAVMGPFGDMKRDLRSILERFERAAEDDSIQGMVLKIHNPDIGRGKINELRQGIKRFRESGKKVYAQLDMAMPADYLVASACDEIIMPEAGMLVLPGVRLETMFYKGLLDKIGVQADFLHMGEAKGAAEPLTRSSFSEPVRANLTALTDDLFEHMVETIAFDRPITRQQATDAINHGLITAKRAKELGLIDRLAYASDLRSELGKSYNAKELVYVQNYGKQKVDTDFSGPTGFLKLLKLMSGGSSNGSASGKKIAIVYAVGAIVTGESESGLLGSTTMGSTTIVDALREAADDKDVAAIVLRIDSPGGSAIASDLIWSQIKSIEKPLVASMGNVAASGGYYIAMGADKIYAEPATITGSIGVVGGKVALSGLYDKLGINIDSISRGENSGLFSSTDKFTESERKAIRSMMEETYELFTSKAAEGRGMPVEQLKKLASGKVYTGRQAKSNGLVDEIGTLHDAISEAKKLAGIDPDKDVKFKTLPEQPDFFESLFGNTDAEKEVEVHLNVDLGQLSPELKTLGRHATMLQRVFREPVVLMMPFDLEVK